MLRRMRSLLRFEPSHSSSGPHDHAHRQDIASEQAFFDRYFEDKHEQVAARGYPLEARWLQRARAPRPRPLDYWEYAFHLLGPLPGRRVLDIGCGSGWVTAYLAAAGAEVMAFDVSFEGCRLAAATLRANAHRSWTAVMDAHAIAVRPNSFDLAFASGVLHHMDLATVAREVHNLLKPGGRLVFYEPLAYGPIMWALRQGYLRVKGLREYETTEHEEGLALTQLEPFHRLFRTGEVRPFNFVAKTNRLADRFGRLADTLRWADYLLFATAPFLTRYCTCVVCRFEK
ncbi:MAG: class I SAM-dependent methyltransferase [Candidatus Rokuibacteriota bacterium]